VENLIALLVAAPLLGAVVLLCGGRRLDAVGHWIGTILSSASFVIGVVLFTDLLGKNAEHRTLMQHLWTWVPVEGFQADVTFRLDQLSMTFVLLITGVGSLIHLYSVGYMEHDERRRRFFGYLNLFLAAMLILVLADNYLLLYVGWEGVGLASYLLIGFWQHKPSAATAAKKAFLVNRVGDMGLSIAIMLMFTTFGTFAFGPVLSHVGDASEGKLTGIALMLLLAACGKSAQVPLQSWLGDAMEGPTPVSALIHAATMVTAGVYLIVRSGAIFNAAPDAQLVVTVVGAVTLLFGAIVGCAKDDIKKALAGSTMSQIGYMVLAAGLGPIGYVFAIMHLVTHGFFKAGLFLGAGSVMHGMNDEVDMRKYGGLQEVHAGHLHHLRPRLPGHHRLPGPVRLLLQGQDHRGGLREGRHRGLDPRRRGPAGRGHHGVLHDARDADDLLRREALAARRERQRAAPARVPEDDDDPDDRAGLRIGLRRRHLRHRRPLPALAGAHHRPRGGQLPGQRPDGHPGHHGGARHRRRDRLGAVRPPPVPAVAPRGSLLTRAARRDLLQDDFNHVVLVRGGEHLTRSLVYVDHTLVDGVVNGTAASMGGLSGRLRKLQNGYARSYAVSMFGGAAILVAATLLMRAV
jgi:NADH-quinone oxidoreductase subunit L